MRTTGSNEIMAISEINQAEEPRITCLIRDVTNTSAVSTKSVTFPESYTVQHLVDRITQDFGYKPKTYKLLYESHDTSTYEVHNSDEKLCDYSQSLGGKSKARFQITEIEDGVLPQPVDDSDSVGGIKFDEFSIADNNVKPATESFTRSIYNDRFITPTPSYDSLMQPETGFCGLVNQAMTCYLNSLLQTLFMTPEFRNAIYNWEFKAETSKVKAEKCIPYQLQRLFLRMQTGKQRAVETTPVTISFGWDSSYSWQQHDVQELCRVMFDALEINWKDTSQADLINKLYQGKLKDYVKCLECKTESAREDAYLDIPLVIKPFGALQAFSSVEEALKAFVAPEILNGNNQYQCDNCNRKCDAHKGLKFVSFPCLLTLQLKRFDFDYNTMHRIKLNDRMVFPEILNLNSLVDDNTMPATPIPDEERNGFDAQLDFTNPPSYSEVAYLAPDDFSDLDLTDTDIAQQLIDEHGEYVYELFSIMIHSGSAIGGHYYAYIKCFSDGQWYSFNDQNVSRITREDIKKVYGGSGSRGLFSTTYTSSTNAYMLMYRKIDPKNNAGFITDDGLPEHIKKLIDHLDKEIEDSQKAKERERNTCRVNTYCLLPNTRKPVHRVLEVHKDLSLDDATTTAYNLFELKGVVNRDCVRIVKYDQYNDVIDRSYDLEDERCIGDILGGVKATYLFELLLEIRQPDEEWQDYKPGGLTLKVLLIDLNTGMVKDPENVRVNQNDIVKDLKSSIGKTLKLANVTNMRCALEERYSGPVQLLADSSIIRDLNIHKGSKVYVDVSDSADIDDPFQASHMYKLIERYQNTITLHIKLPTASDIERFKNKELSRLQNSDYSRHTATKDDDEDGSSSDRSCHSDKPSPGAPMRRSAISCITSNHQDSLLKDPPPAYDEIDKLEPHEQYSGKPPAHSYNSDVDDELPLGASSRNSGSFTNLTETECSQTDQPIKHEDNCSNENQPPPTGETSQTEAGYETVDTKRLTPSKPSFQEDGFLTEEIEYGQDGKQNTLNVQIDKRTNVGKLKQLLVNRLDLPVNLFKMYKVYSSNQESECGDHDSLTVFADNTRMTVKLSRVLRKGEYNTKIYELILNTRTPSESSKYMFDMVLSKGLTIAQVRQLVSDELHYGFDREVPPERIRLRKKTWKNPGVVFIDTQRIEEDIVMYANWEMFIHVLDAPESISNSDDLCIFVLQWKPAVYEFGLMSELIVPHTADHLTFAQQLSELSGIPANQIEIAKGRGEFPGLVSVLDAHVTGLDWKKISVSTVENLQLRTGDTLMYRDKEEPLPKLSVEKRKEITLKESSTYGRSAYSGYTRKENALKIYTDDFTSVADELD